MKKHYTSAHYEHSPEGFILLLDNKPACTPAKKPFIIPYETLAKAIADEWQLQGEVIRKETMPLSRLACVAIDLVAEKRAELMKDVLPYAETDLVCYRAGDIPDLAHDQARDLDPILFWVQERFALTFNVTDGLMPITQPKENQAKLATILSAYDDWKFAPLVASVGPLGSLILALAFIESRINADEAFTLSHLEESYETEKWGQDEEKEKKIQKVKEEIMSMERFLRLV